MAEKPGPFVIHGTAEKHKPVTADEVLNAIAEGQDINIQYSVIQILLISE